MSVKPKLFFSSLTRNRLNLPTISERIQNLQVTTFAVGIFVSRMELQVSNFQKQTFVL